MFLLGFAFAVALFVVVALWQNHVENQPAEVARRERDARRLQECREAAARGEAQDAERRRLRAICFVAQTEQPESQVKAVQIRAEIEGDV